MTTRKSDVAGMKAMLTGVFAKAAQAKGGATRGGVPNSASKIPVAPERDPAVRLSLGPEATEDAPARPFENPGIELAGRLEPAIQALARDLGRLLTAFGMDGTDAAAAEAALTARFGAGERGAAIAALDGSTGELRLLAEETRQDVAIDFRKIGLAVTRGQVDWWLDDAILVLTRVPAEETHDGLTAMLGAIRTAIRPGKGLTVETDRIAIDDLGGVMAGLTAAMTEPPQGLEGTVTLSPLAAPAEDGRMELSLSLSGRLGSGVGETSSREMPARERPVGEVKERGFDVRI
ncbi:hypothetical protein [Azospirillum endophyticum]